MTSSEIRKGRKPTLVSIYGSLNPEDVQRLNKMAFAKGKAPSALVREAVLLFLDGQETEVIDAREALVEKRLKKMEDRLASLMARTAIDAGMIFQILQANMNPETKSEDLMWAHKLAVERLKSKLTGQNASVKELVIESEKSNSENSEQDTPESDQPNEEMSND